MTFQHFTLYVAILIAVLSVPNINDLPITWQSNIGTIQCRTEIYYRPDSIDFSPCASTNLEHIIMILREALHQLPAINIGLEYTQRNYEADLHRDKLIVYVEDRYQRFPTTVNIFSSVSAQSISLSTGSFI